MQRLKIQFIILLIVCATQSLQALSNNVLYLDSLLHNATQNRKKVIPYDFLIQFIENSNQPTIVMLYADWCGPCKRMKPKVFDSAEHYKGILYILVNVDLFPDIKSAFNVRYISTLIFFKNNQQIAMTNSISQGELNQKNQFLLA